MNVKIPEILTTFRDKSAVVDAVYYVVRVLGNVTLWLCQAGSVVRTIARSAWLS